MTAQVTTDDRTAIYIAASLAQAGMLAHVRVSEGSATFSSSLAHYTTVYSVSIGPQKLGGVAKDRALEYAKEQCARPLADLPRRPAGMNVDATRAWELAMVDFAAAAGAHHVDEEREGGIHASGVSFRLTRYELYAGGYSLAEKVSEAARALSIDLPRQGAPAQVPQGADAIARAIAAAEEAEEAAEDAADWSMIADSWVRIAEEQRKRAE